MSVLTQSTVANKISLSFIFFGTFMERLYGVSQEFKIKRVTIRIKDLWMNFIRIIFIQIKQFICLIIKKYG